MTSFPRTFVVAALASTVLAACATSGERPGLTLIELETPRHQLLERKRLPADFARVQRNLFRHARVCGVTYTFEMAPRESSYGRVVYRPTPDAGWDRSVVISMVLLHDRSIDVRAYSYYAGQMDRVRRMLTAMFDPDSCTASDAWENDFQERGDEGDEPWSVPE